MGYVSCVNLAVMMDNELRRLMAYSRVIRSQIRSRNTTNRTRLDEAEAELSRN